MKNIYALDLLEETFEKKDQYNPRSLSIRRVPGGWIFTEFEDSSEESSIQVRISAVFVPYNDEFKPRTKTNMSDPSIM